LLKNLFENLKSLDFILVPKLFSRYNFMLFWWNMYTIMIDQWLKFYYKKTRNKKMHEVTGFGETKTSKLEDYFMRKR